MQPPTGGGSGSSSLTGQMYDSIVGYWPLYENVASGARHDLSGNGLLLSDSGLVNTATGQCNAKCANFTAASTNQLSVAGLALNNTKAHLTIAFLHFATTHAGAGEQYLTKGTGADGGATTPDWGLSSANPGKLDFIVTDSAHSQKIAEVAAANSTLYFCVLRYNPRTAKIGISLTAMAADAISGFTETAMPNPMVDFSASNWPLRVSGNGFGGGHFTGTCEELAVLKGYELSTAQLDSLFQKVRAGRPLFR
jgi:hypothetical protein